MLSASLLIFGYYAILTVTSPVWFPFFAVLVEYRFPHSVFFDCVGVARHLFLGVTILAAVALPWFTMIP